MDKYFGTDGIRGRVGIDIDGDIAFRLGNALGKRSHMVVVGRDTRLSGNELYKYLRKGLLDSGSDIVNLEIVPTPVVAYVTSKVGADFGVVITASHNSREYNGLKVFTSNGGKLTRRQEMEIEKDMASKVFISHKRGSESIGKYYLDNYIDMLTSSFEIPRGIKVGIDTANGALSYVAKQVLSHYVDDLTIINGEGNGYRINMGSGALYPDTIANIVKDKGLDVGFTYDGDGDRIIAIDERGNIINGDLILYAIANQMKKKGLLNNDVIVGTIYTNMGVEKALSDNGITLRRSDVGDSNVASLMRKIGANVGGERAGHIILSDYMATGDGLLVSLYILSMLGGNMLSSLTDVAEYKERSFDMVTSRAKEIAADEEILDTKKEIEYRTKSMILIRASGTEAKLRIKVESKLEEDVDYAGDEIVKKIKKKYNI